MRALLIEDKKPLSQQLMLLLSDRGHDVTLVESVDALSQIGNGSRFELFVIDVRMPGFDCIAFLDAQQRLGRSRRTLLLSVTETLRRQVSELGFGPEQCIANPENRLALLAALRTLEAQPASGDSGPQSGDPGAKNTPDAAPEQAKAPRGRVVVFASHKGGTGKTTLAMHLIAGLLRNNLKVASIDLDHPQHSLTRYIENRRAYVDRNGLQLPLPLHQAPDMPMNDLEALERGIREYRRRMNVVVIDCPAGYNRASRAVITVADTLITPINDSFLDLDLLAVVEPKTLEFRRLGPFGELVNDARQRRRQWHSADLDWVVIRNRLSNLGAQNKIHMADALDQLTPRLGFRQGPGLSERVVYRELFLEGLTLLDLRRDGIDRRLSLSLVSARQELRGLLDLLDRASAAETANLRATA